MIDRDVDSLHIRASLSPTEAKGVAIGTSLPVQFVTESGGMCAAITGRVTSITPTPDGSTGSPTIEIEIEVDAAQLKVISVDLHDVDHSVTAVAAPSDIPKL